MTYCDSSIHHDPEKFMVVFFVSNFLLQNLHIFFKKKKKKFDFNQKRIFSVKKICQRNEFLIHFPSLLDSVHPSASGSTVQTHPYNPPP